MAIYGRTVDDRVSVTLGSSTTNSLLAGVFGAMPQHGWAYAIQVGLVSRFDADAIIRPHLWATDANGAPAGLLGSGAAFAPGATDAVYTQALSTPAPMAAGLAYAVGIGHYHRVTFSVGRPLATPLPASRRSGLAASTAVGPYDPYGTGTVYEEALPGLAVLYDPNVAPSQPTGLAPAGTVQNIASAIFTAPFVDANQTVNGQANPGEELSAYRVQLRAPGATSLLWDGTYEASGTEAANDAWARGYGGATLAQGQSYEWRTQVADAFGAWSAWSDWVTIFVANAGTVTLGGAAGGKKLTQQPNLFPATWQHVSALAMNAYQVQILQTTTQGGVTTSTVVRESPLVTASPTIAVGGSFSAIPNEAAWATYGWAPLSRGAAYSVRVRGRDTNGVWSTYSPATAFTVNAQPQTPDQLTPNGTKEGVLPYLMARLRDADNTRLTGLGGSLRFKNPNGTTRLTRALVWVSGDTWGYQMVAGDRDTSVDANGYGTYAWDVVASDGTFSSDPSAEASFLYADVPTVAITSPTQGQVLSSPTVSLTWTVAGSASQARRRVRVYEAGTADLIADTGWVTTSTLSAAVAIPALNGAPYEAEVELENAAGNSNVSPRRRFTVVYPPPATIANVVAVPERYLGDRDLSTIRVTWDPSVITTGWANYGVLRRTVSPSGTRGPWVAMPNGVITSKTQTTYIDSTAVLKQVYEYGVIQTQEQGGAITVSDPGVTVEPVSVTFRGVVLSDAENAFDLHLVLDYIDQSSTSDVRDQELVETWADGAPLLFESGLAYSVIKETYRLLGYDGQTSYEQLRTLQRMRDVRPNKTPIVVWYRDDTGRAMKVRITSLDYDRTRMNRFIVSVEFTEVRG